MPQARYNVAGHYLSGRGVPQDFQKAAQAFEEAAEAGMVHAMVSRDWKRLSAGGHTLKQPELASWEGEEKTLSQPPLSRQVNLGNMHLEGLGELPQSTEKARYWFTRAAALGNETAEACLKKLDKE